MSSVFSRSAKALKHLSSSDTEQQLTGLQLLQERAHEDSNSLLSKRGDCVSATVKLLRSSDSKVKKSAASFLACLVDNGGREKVCAEAGAVEGLVGMLGDSSAEVRMEAVHTLTLLLVLGEESASMQIDCSVQDRIGSMPSALSALVPLLSSSSNSQPQLQIAGKDLKSHIDSVSKMMDTYSVTGGRVRAKMGKLTAAAGLKLPDVLDSSSVDSSEAAARLIACLAHNHPANQSSIAAVPGAVSALLGLLRSSHAGTALAGADAIFALSEGNLAIQETIGQQPSAFAALVDLLVGPNSILQRTAACAVASLCSMARSNAGRFIACARSSEGLLRLLNSLDARAAGAAAATMAYLGSRGPVGQRMLEEHAAAVCTALGHLADPSNHPGQRSARLVAQALEGLAKDSTDFRRAMRASPEALGLLRKLHECSEDETSDAAAAALERVLPGSIAPPITVVKIDPPKPPGYPVVNRGSSAGNNQDAQDISSTSDQSSAPCYGVIAKCSSGASSGGNSMGGSGRTKRFHGTNNKLATAIEVVEFVQVCGKVLSLGGLGPADGAIKMSLNLGGVLSPLVEILKLVHQARTNKAKAKSLGSRAEALADFMHCIFIGNDGEQLLRNLMENPPQLKVFDNQFNRLGKALGEAEALVAKWARPLGIKIAVRVIKAQLDKEDIKDIENSINKSVADLSTVMSTMNLVQTAGMRHELLEAVTAVATAGVPLEVAQAEDVKALQCDISELVGGQQELAAQLAAATAEERAEWEEAKAQLTSMAAALQEIKDGVAGVAAGVGEVHEAVQRVDSKVSEVADGVVNVRSTVEQVDSRVEEINREVQRQSRELAAFFKEMRQSAKAPAAAISDSVSDKGSGSSRGGLCDRLVLDSSRVHWESVGPSLDRGSFANVYPGTFDGARVAVKQLDMTAFAGKEEVEMYREAAVLSHLGHHPCIVHFYGLVVEQLSPDKPHQPPAMSGNSFTAMHDSAGSGGLRALGGGMPAAAGKAGPRLSVGLVMELCDMSLQQWLRENPTPCPLRTAVHVGVCIAGGLKYLHEDAPITVVHADLKPANVLIKGLDIKLADFGLSHTIAINTMRQEAGGLMGGGSSMGGTALWSAPELLEAWSGGKDAPHTPAGDIFALGLILYQLLAGRAQHPWEGEVSTIDAVKDAVRHGKRPSWDAVHAKRQQQCAQLQEKDAAVVAQLLGDLREVVEACWQGEPSKRPSAREVLSLLGGVQRKLPASGC